MLYCDNVDLNPALHPSHNKNKKPDWDWDLSTDYNLDVSHQIQISFINTNS